MARDFSKNTSNYMSLGTNAISPLLNGAAKISIFAKINPDSFETGTNDNRIFAAAVANNLGGISLGVDGSVTPKLLRCGARSQSGDGFQARNGTTTIATGTWFDVGALFDISGDVITPYVNGAAENSGAATFGAASYTNGTPTIDIDHIGLNTGTDAPPITAPQFDGRIAEVALWIVDIGAAGFLQLSKGFSPMMVRPDGLVFYAPLIGKYSPEKDIRNSKSGAISGTVAAADHPRIFMPTSSLMRRFTTAAGGAETVTLDKYNPLTNQPIFERTKVVSY